MIPATSLQHLQRVPLQLLSNGRTHVIAGDVYRTTSLLENTVPVTAPWVDAYKKQGHFPDDATNTPANPDIKRYVLAVGQWPLAVIDLCPKVDGQVHDDQKEISFYGAPWNIRAFRSAKLRINGALEALTHCALKDNPGNQFVWTPINAKLSRLYNQMIGALIGLGGLLRDGEGNGIGLSAEAAGKLTALGNRKYERPFQANPDAQTEAESFMRTQGPPLPLAQNEDLNVA